MGRFDTPSEFPGQTVVAWRQTRPAVALGAVAGVLWPPLILTLPFLPPHNWTPGQAFDFRLMALLIGAVAVPAGLWLIGQERRRIGRPATRLGIVWRFMLYAGLLAATLQVGMALALTLWGWTASANVLEAIGSSETVLLIYGVGLLPVAILVGVSYGLWAGVCAAWLAFMPAPQKVRDRLGLLSSSASRTTRRGRS